MTIDFVTRSFYWLPRVGGGLSGTYQALPANVANYFIADTSPLPSGLSGLNYNPLPLPAWLPRQIFISHIWMAFGSAAGGTVEMSAWVDPGGIAFNSSGGPEVGSDFTRDCSLLHYAGSPPAGSKYFNRRIDPPILCDRDAGDKLAADIASSIPIDWLYLEWGFLVPNTIQPSAPGSGYLPSDPPPSPPTPSPTPSGAWATRAGPVVLNTNQGGWSGYTLAVTISATALSNTAAGSQTRVTFSPTASIGAAYIGPPAGPMVPMTQQGDGTWLASQGVDGSSGLLVKASITGGTLATTASQSGWATYYALGSDAANTGVNGYTKSVQGAVGVQKVEGLYP